jgi:thioredoxin 1
MKKIILLAILIIASSIFMFGQAPTTNEIVLTDANFDKLVLNSNKVVMVDFWATWCGPCRMLAPTVSELADDYEGKILVGKLDVDKNKVISSRYNIRSIPTILFFKNGKLVDQQIGVVPKSVLEAKIEKLIKN